MEQARPLEGARPLCKGTDDNRQTRWNLRKRHIRYGDGDKMKWPENTIREEVRQTGTDAKKGRGTKERDIERRTKEGTGKTYKQNS